MAEADPAHEAPMRLRATPEGSARAVLYARVSTRGQAGRGYSLAQQVEALREHAACAGYQISRR